jgi:hypothetical protein
MEKSRSWEANNRKSSQETSQNFMEPEGSLPYSQGSTTRPSPEPKESSSQPHISFP